MESGVGQGLGAGQGRDARQEYRRKVPAREGRGRTGRRGWSGGSKIGGGGAGQGAGAVWRAGSQGGTLEAEG